jgi:hypothetical protein
MKIILNMLSKKWFVLCLLLLSIMGNAQTFSISLSNATQTSTSTFEVDVMISVLTPTNGVRLASVSCGINYNAGILNGGTPCTTNNCGSWSLVPGTVASELSSLLTPSLSLRSTAPVRVAITMINQGGAVASDVPVGTYRLGRFRFTNTVPFAQASNANLWLQNVIQGGNQNAIVGWFAAGTSTPIANATTITSGSTGQITSLSHTSASPLTLMLNAQVCATSASQTASSEVTCFGGSNGSSTITMSPTPTVSSITYTVDGGASQSATLVGGSFTISGLSAGTHAVVISNSGCSNVTATGVSVNGPSQLTNTTSASACDSYTWSVTGQTYTESGTYTGTTTNGNGCTVNETLNLTINSNSITSQPTAPVICKLLGASATVSVVAANASSPSYQWFSQATAATTGWTPLVNNVNYSGVTTSTLTITRTTTTVPPVGTKYRVEVSGGSCGTTSSSNTVALQDQTVLSKVATPTVVTKLTPALTACEGSSVVLSLAAGSIGNIQLQSSADGISWSNLGSVVAQSAVNAANPLMTFNTGALTQTTWFRLMASNGVCNSVVSASVKITVSTTPDAGTISGGDVTVCTPVAAALDLSGTTVAITNSTTLTLTGSSLGATILWQKSINYLSATPTWAAAGSTTPSLTVTNLAASTWYRAQVTNGACVVYADVVKITVTPTAKAGAISSAASVCYGGDITFTSAAYVGSSIQWQISTTSATTGFADVSGETGIAFNMTSVAYAPLSKFYVRTVVTSGNCTIARSAVKTIIVNPTSVAGTVTGGGTVCNSGLAGTLKLAGNTGTIQWQYSTDGVNYINAPKATAGTAPTFTTTSASSIAATYVVSNVTSDTYFRALVTSGACSSAVSNAVQYVVGTAAVAGTATAASNEVCPTFGTTITLAGSTGSIAWKKSTNWTAATPTWSAVTTSVSPTLSTGALAASAAYKAVVTIGGCSTVESNVVVVIVTAKPVSKGITANVTSPAGAATTPLCTSSTSKVLTVTAGYLGDIQWQSSTTSTTAGFTDISGATATTYTISGASVGANYFRAKFTNSCGITVFSPALTVYYKDCTPPAKTAAPFGVVVYPNPSSENFNFNLSTSSEEKVSVVVYDMTGKLVDSREVAPTEVSELQLGDRYPSGVYNMIVTQGDNTKTLRVIKR